MNIKDIKAQLDSKINAIKAHIEVIALGKFPHAVITSTSSFNSIYDPSGMRIIDREYRCVINIKTTAPESSHPGLDRPISNIKLTIALKSDGTYTINQNYPTDSVDVHYCKYDSKVNRKNVTIARKWHTRAIKYFSTTFKKHVPHQGPIQPDQLQALQTYIQFLTENENLRNELFIIRKRIVPNDKDLKHMRKHAHHRSGLTLGHELGLTYENHTFYLNDNPIAKRKQMNEYINNNPEFFIPEFQTKYPIISTIQN